MATPWIENYVKCPFYRGTDTYSRITCQGVADSSQLELILILILILNLWRRSPARRVLV